MFGRKLRSDAAQYLRVAILDERHLARSEDHRHGLVVEVEPFVVSGTPLDLKKKKK
jgi:hypothetical protein